MAATEIPTVTILAVRLGECRDALAKLAKRGARYGQTISWTESPRTEQRGTRRAIVAKEGGGTEWRSLPIMVDVVDLQITGEAPRVGDFELEASLERTPGGIIIASAPGTDKSVGKLGRQWDGRCEHCGSNRARVHGYIVRKGRNRKVVGRSCLRDYLGCDAPASLAARFAFLRDLAALGDEDSWGGYGSSLNIVDDLIATARACIKLWGWRPASFDGQTTACQVWLRDRVVFGKHDGEAREQKRQLLAELKANGDHYREEAAQIIEWARALRPGRSDYLHNLQVACGADVVKPKHSNLVISAAAAWDKQKEREAERAAAKAAEPQRPPSDWIGTAGQRLQMDAAELIQRRVLPDNGYGESTLFKFALASGPILTWITGSAPRELIKADLGAKFDLVGTVKRHSEFRDVKETQLSRCKVAPATVPA